MTYKPPFVISKDIFSLCQSIARELGVLEGAKLQATPVGLRKKNNIRTIQASLAIEGNLLSVEQITHLFEGKRVIGPKKDILEVKNALDVYESLGSIDPLSIDVFLKTHAVLTRELVNEPGCWRFQKGRA